MTDFTTDDIVCAYEIPGLCDGTAVYLLRDGTLVNRFAGATLVNRFAGAPWPTRLIARVDEWIAQEWIAQHGDAIRELWADELDGGEA